MKKKRRKTSNIVLTAAVAAVVSYGLAALGVQVFTGTELSPTLTTAWFSFWGVEIIALAAIKNCKTKHKPDEPDDPSGSQ